MAKKIRASVGKKGKNKPEDAIIVQELLKKVGYKLGKSGPKKDGVDGDCGPKTIEAISQFQKKIGMQRPDGLVEPDGRTFAALNNRGKPPNESVKKKPNSKETDEKKTDAKKAGKTTGGKSASSFQLSAKATKLLKDIESLRLKPYDDQTGKDISAWVKGATIGYGHLISKSEWATYKDGITESQAKALFTKDIDPYVKAVKSKVTAKITQNQFDALVILTFNIGIGGFGSSSVLKLVNDPNAKTSFKSLESAWKAWNKSQGKEMKGLNNRRKAEWNIYSKGVYKRW